MKKFQFQLESVLNFKDQQLAALLTELAAAQAQAAAQERERDAARGRYQDYCREYEQRKREGLTVIQAMEFQSGIQVLEGRVLQEERKLTGLRREAEHKRSQVVEARKEVRALEKLRELRLKEYDKALLKAEEKDLDDLTLARRAAS